MTSMEQRTPQQLCEAISKTPLETSNFGGIPPLEMLYLPRSHRKALRLDAHVVVGGRGVGKSFWTAALQSEENRNFLSLDAPDLKGIDVHIGFSNKPWIDHYPNAGFFQDFIANNGDPFDLWRAVILRWVAKRANHSIPDEDWQATISWLKTEHERFSRIMEQNRPWKGLVLFDALDQTSGDWKHMDEIVRGLLKTVLWLKGFSGIYAKVFLREDQAERTVFNFPDASKITATKAELDWARHDLHGLLWQRLINAPDIHGQYMREILPCDRVGDIWNLRSEMKIESEMQRKAFEKLAGPWMGRDRRRGVPYTWSVGHLADGRGKTSPRSFLAAIKQAAEDSSGRYPDREYALHYESIKRGIQKASEIRVDEMREDYPWAPKILEVLKGTNVPNEYSNVRECWADKFSENPKDSSLFSSGDLPAQRAERGWDGIRDDLIRLGLIEIRKDGRVDMPDLYRVGFGLGRRGGVKPKG